jgi:multisubunit Na+/H+ antiporter MnhG subunit
MNSVGAHVRSHDQIGEDDMADEHEDHEDHGHSTAAWTGVAVVLLGSAIASVAVLIPSLVLGIIGAVVIVVGVAAAKLLSMAGYGGGVAHAQSGSVIDAPDEAGAGTVGKS